MMRKNKLFAILFALITSEINAAQLIEVADDSEHKVTISSYELNRIKIQGGRIEGFRALEGDLSAVPDSKKGELFIHLPRKYSQKLTNIFITSESGATFKLLLVPKNIPAEQIFLIERATPDKKLEISDQYRDKLIDFYKKIQKNELIENYEIIHEKQKFKHDNLKLTRITTYESRDKTGFYGEIFEVKNTSKEIKILSPQDFHQHGIRAVKLDNHILSEGQTTKMYIISIKG